MSTIPLAVVVIELGCDINKLARKLAAEIVVDEQTGLRMVPDQICRQLTAERDHEHAAREAAAAAHKLDMAAIEARHGSPRERVVRHFGAAAVVEADVFFELSSAP